MLSRLRGWDDTIVALATPPGSSAIGVIRMSGALSFAIIDRLFPSKRISELASHTAAVGFLKENNTPLDEVVVTVFRSPRSYTGEDMIEISCHGSPYVLEEVIRALIRQGARPAKPGEFTQRAFLNGKLDLAQAESVADIIASNTEASLKTAIQNMRGGFSQTLKVLREKILEFSSLIELELDFSQEDVEFADREKFVVLLNDAVMVTSSLLESFRLGNVIKNGVKVSIVGKPNAGKSTLLNALLNENRAIVSDIPGTTRDTIEEVINIGGVLFRLIDTAGLREQPTNHIEILGIQRSRIKIQEADVVILLFDVMDEHIEESRTNLGQNTQSKQILTVINKIDLVGEKIAKQRFSNSKDVIFISAKQKQNIENLRSKLLESVIQDGAKSPDVIITNMRHFDILQKVLDSLNLIKTGISNKVPVDLVASDIRECLHYLGEITGEISTEDQLDYIFSKFCIGK
ncbi:MAG TPA: tRNA uridine-5-carboxymethylaminomethyl(34) synthesis GTPase MnmE [Puia sp.]|nr:tRNA uridine-5-carboxymethylaminomethyl(34) synthesis GTPase MnmE [Puia sp.]